MLRLGLRSFLAVGLLMGGNPSLLRASASAEPPVFSDVYDTIRTHLAGANDAELNRAAVEGLLGALAPKVALVTNRSELPESGVGTPVVSKSSLFDEAIAYVRVERIGEGLAEAVRQACQQLGKTNPLKGLVLDLRYAGGHDYAAAAAAADLFLKKERPLLNWGEGMTQSKAKTDALSLPVAALVNRRTAGAAEALAALVRETGTGLILGGKTAGQAMIAREYPLKNGDHLRIATAPIQLGDGSDLSGGVKPDIAIEVNLQDERAYYADAYQATATPNLVGTGSGQANPVAAMLPGTNSGRRLRFNEAELVRERREGINLEGDLLPLRGHELEKPQVRDPVLARALDLLKALAVVRQARS